VGSVKSGSSLKSDHDSNKWQKHSTHLEVEVTSMKLKLIYPRSPYTIDNLYNHSKIVDLFFLACDKMLGGGLYTPGKKMFLVPPLNLMLLAALVPEDIEVEIVDERTAPIDYDDTADLIGITCMTADAPHAYTIADRFRSQGTKVVLGGIHPTIMPAEAGRHADAVVIGEAENILDCVLRDAEKGQLQKFYESSSFHDLRNLKIARRDLISEEYYITKNLIQTTRGCPHRCSFCSISVVAGPQYRCRPTAEVIGEIESLDGKLIGFVDDNINGNITYAKELFEALIPLNTRWYGDATILLGENEKMLSLAAKSGCRMLLIGFESLSQNTLNSLNKRFNKVSHFRDVIRRIHDQGIGVIGSFILGLDGDTQGEFDQLVDFANDANLDLVQVSILTPYPGTQLFNEMDASNRLLTKEWGLYDTTRGNVIFRPQLMTTDELRGGYFEVYERLYRFSSILKRIGGSRSFPAFFIPYNLRQRKKIKSAKKQYFSQVQSEAQVAAVDS
jgi:radical SAM superfamily enzyme YgiQ (UPF0313 family)